MQDLLNSMDLSLAGLEQKEWKSQLVALVQEHGEYWVLGKRHFATLVRERPVLLVTFETVHGIRSLSENAHPFGFEMVRAQGWSHLCIVSDGDTWFRDPAIYEFFDDLTDDGFFEEFDRVIFYGAGPCGYAAAAFSVAAPGSVVVAVQPQATLDPRITEWDPRFTDQRHLCFTDRYGFAPDMIEAAEQAFILYDPREEFDAMHAALFRRPNVTRFRMRSMGDALQTRLIEMGILYRIVLLAGRGKLTETAFYRLYRARRGNIPYLRGLMARLDAQERPVLNVRLCRHVTSHMNAPRFRRRLVALEKQAAAGDFTLPPCHG